MNIFKKIKESKLNKSIKFNNANYLDTIESIDELYSKFIIFHRRVTKSKKVMEKIFGESKYEVKLDLFELILNKLSEIQIKINVDLDNMYKSSLETYSDIFTLLNSKLRDNYIYLFVNDTTMMYKVFNVLNELNDDLNKIKTIELQNVESEYLHFKESLHLGIDNLLKVKENYKSNQQTLEILQHQMKIKKENVSIVEKELNLIQAGELAKFEKFSKDLFCELLNEMADYSKYPKSINVQHLKFFISYFKEVYENYPNLVQILNQMEKDILKISIGFMDLNILKIKNNNKFYFFTDREEVLSASINKLNFFNYKLKSDKRMDFNTFKHKLNSLKILYDDYIKLHKNMGELYPMLITSNKIVIEHLTESIQNFLFDMASEKTTMSATYFEKNYIRIKKGMSEIFRNIDDLTALLEVLTTDKNLFVYADKIEKEKRKDNLFLNYRETYINSYSKYHLESVCKKENSYLNERNYISVQSQKEILLQTILNKFSDFCTSSEKEITITIQDMEYFKHHFYLIIYLLKVSVEENQKKDKFKNFEKSIGFVTNVVDDIAIKQALGNYTQKIRVSKSIKDLNRELTCFINYISNNIYEKYLRADSLFDVEYDKEQFEINLNNLLNNAK